LQQKVCGFTGKTKPSHFPPVPSIPVPATLGIFCVGENRGESQLPGKGNQYRQKMGEDEKWATFKAVSLKALKKWMSHYADLCR